MIKTLIRTTSLAGEVATFQNFYYSSLLILNKGKTS